MPWLQRSLELVVLDFPEMITGPDADLSVISRPTGNRHVITHSHTRSACFWNKNVVISVFFFFFFSDMVTCYNLCSPVATSNTKCSLWQIISWLHWHWSHGVSEVLMHSVVYSTHQRYTQGLNYILTYILHIINNRFIGFCLASVKIFILLLSSRNLL